MVFLPSLSWTTSPQARLWIFVVYALLACISVLGGQELITPSKLELQSGVHPQKIYVRRSDFTSDFLFGAGTSAAQIEGAMHEGGRGPSIIDENNEKLPENESHYNEVGLDSYRRYKEDVKNLKDLGLNSYEFSISWNRILPNGSLSGGVSQEGIDYYNRVIDELLKNDIKPFLKLYHFDSPQALQEKYGGPLNRSFVDDFKDYAEICFNAFGDRVKYWITIVEPSFIARFGHDFGFALPNRCSDRKICAAGNSSTEPYIVGHNLLLAHATAARLYKDKFQRKQRGQIGLSLIAPYYLPYSNSVDDKIATKRAMDFQLGWFVDPLVYGDYPISMKKLVNKRLPSFTAQEKKLVHKSFDFIGLNYYSTKYAKNIPITSSAPRLNMSNANEYIDEFVYITDSKDGIPIGPKAEGSSFIIVYPEGLHKLLVFMKENYQNPIVYITENGIIENPNNNINVALKDPHRIDFIYQHLYWINRAIKERVKVKGYIYWSLYDDQAKFGLYYVDFKNNITRIPKDSAKWIHQFLKT